MSPNRRHSPILSRYPVGPLVWVVECYSGECLRGSSAPTIIAACAEKAHAERIRDEHAALFAEGDNCPDCTTTPGEL